MCQLEEMGLDTLYDSLVGFAMDPALGGRRPGKKAVIAMRLRQDSPGIRLQSALAIGVLVNGCAGLPAQTLSAAETARRAPFRLATFSADVTVPLGHRCMGVLPIKARKVVDPLYVHGFVLLGAGEPVVLAAVDWCEIRNDSYDEWRETLAAAAETSRERVLVCCLHQHDAPVIDGGAEKLLANVGLAGELFDTEFHVRVLERVAESVRRGLQQLRTITDIGIGQAQVQKIASNRRIVHHDGRIDFSRGSSSGGKAIYRNAPEGVIDPWLKTISFWNRDDPILALHCYATHPMSHYGQGGVSADFVGMARRRRQQDDPSIVQIYVTGCAGDVTAGKYNDGSPENRAVLANRLYSAMKAAWADTRHYPLRRTTFRNAELELPFITDAAFTHRALTKTLEDNKAKTADRILAAMGLSTRQRIAAGRTIDVPCVNFGPARIVLLPGESFVGYQRMAQRFRPDSFVMTIGYGECWPGYIPTAHAFDESFGQSWRWVTRGSEWRIRAALQQVLIRPEPVSNGGG